MDFEHARSNMIEQQIRTWEVLDQRTLDLIDKVHREDFIPEEYRQLALADVSIPLAHGQITMAPKLEARLLQSLNIKADDIILEVGTGCAYLTALLAKAGNNVHSVDIFPDFTKNAEEKLRQQSVNNVQLYTGDALHGWEKGGPYDVIVITGSVPKLGKDFQEQLTVNGRLFVITGQSPAMEALLITRVKDQIWTSESLFETDLPPLIGAEAPSTFKF